MGCSEALEKQLEYTRLLEAPGKAGLLEEWERIYFLRTIQSAQPYFWSSEMCRLLAETSATIPDWTLLEENLYTSSGFCWFESPLEYNDDRFGIRELLGLSWSWADARFNHRDGSRHLSITFWGRVPSRWGGYPIRSSLWSEGTSLSKSLDEMYRVAEGGHVEEASGQFMTESARVLRYFATMMQFLYQKILVTPTRSPERATIRRVEREYKMSLAELPVLRVVELRAREHAHHASDFPDGESREYSCQWVVRGHWRQQYYPSLRIHQPKWILPYVKGPEDKPLKPPRATVFAVVR